MDFCGGEGGGGKEPPHSPCGVESPFGFEGEIGGDFGEEGRPCFEEAQKEEFKVFFLVGVEEKEEGL